MQTIDFTRLTRRPAVDTKIIHDLESYWQTLRHAQRLPARTDIAPDAIDAILPHAFILQRVAAGTARFRVAGQCLHDVLKMDARGMPLSVMFTPEARSRVHPLLEKAFTGPAIVELPLISEPSRFKSAISGRMLLLPMRDQNNEATRMLGALVTDKVTGSRPYRFDIDADRPVRTEMLGLRVAASTPQTAPAPAKRPDTGQRPALQLVVDNG